MKFIFGNIKMNQTPHETMEFVKKIEKSAKKHIENKNLCVCIFPPQTSLFSACKTSKRKGLHIGGQNVCAKECSSQTGEVSANMIGSCGAKFCLVGHSERRKIFGETNNDVLQKMQNLINSNITPVLCVGETLEEKENRKTETVLKNQLAVLKKITSLENIIVAYEPVWAIGTGLSMTEDEAIEIFQKIKNILFQSTRKIDIPLLYGGSLNEKNLNIIFQKNVDGGLIGSACLNPNQFCEIIESTTKKMK